MVPTFVSAIYFFQCNDLQRTCQGRRLYDADKSGLDGGVDVEMVEAIKLRQDGSQGSGKIKRAVVSYEPGIAGFVG